MIEIIPSTLSDVRELSKTIREKDKEEALGLGFTAHRALYHSYRLGFYRRTALIDGEVAAMWGVAGVPLGLTGQPYLVTGTAVEKVSPIRFARIYQREVEEMKKLFPVLENYVDSDYHEAIRMLKVAGFSISKPFIFGPKHKLYRKFSLISNG